MLFWLFSVGHFPAAGFFSGLGLLRLPGFRRGVGEFGGPPSFAWAFSATAGGELKIKGALRR